MEAVLRGQKQISRKSKASLLLNPDLNWIKVFTNFVFIYVSVHVEISKNKHPLKFSVYFRDIPKFYILIDR